MIIVSIGCFTLGGFEKAKIGQPHSQGQLNQLN